MTSTVKVTAHCGSNKRVRVTRTGSTDVVLSDGESYEHSIFDEIQMTAVEEEISAASIATSPETAARIAK